MDFVLFFVGNKEGNNIIIENRYIYQRKESDKMSLQREITHIPIQSIRPNPYQPRRVFNQLALEELSQSIKMFGVIQPISVRKLSRDTYELIAGERRLRASELAKLIDIPAIIVEYKDRESAMVALIENLQREDLNFIEEAEGYNNLIIDHKYTQKELAVKIGKSQSTIANKLRLLKLPTEIKRALVTEGLTERHGRAILKLPDDSLKTMVLEKSIKNNLNVNSTEMLVEDILKKMRNNDEVPNQSVKSLINIRIYLNTIKKAYRAIVDYGINAEYKEEDKGEFVEVTIKIPKR